MGKKRGGKLEPVGMEESSSDPHRILEALLDAVIGADGETVSTLADLSAEEHGSLKVRHSTADGKARLEPEFTLVDGQRVTTAVWLPVSAGAEVLDLYVFDSFEVAGDRVVTHVTSAVPGLDYAHQRAQEGRRRPLPKIFEEDDVPAHRAALVVGFNRDVFEAGDPDAVDRYVTEDYRQHAQWRGESGRAALKEIVKSLRANQAAHTRPRARMLSA